MTDAPRPPAPEAPRWTETLRDGSTVRIRPIRPEDRAAEAAFIEGLSPQSRRYRFLGQVAHPDDALLDRLVDVDFRHDFAFVALAGNGAAETIVGVARYGVDPGGTACECAVTVADAWQDRGVGATLMRHLIDVARERGIRTMYSIDAAENAAMNALARYLGFRSRPEPGDARQTVHRLDLQAPAAPPG